MRLDDARRIPRRSLVAYQTIHETFKIVLDIHIYLFPKFFVQLKMNAEFTINDFQLLIFELHYTHCRRVSNTPWKAALLQIGRWCSDPEVSSLSLPSEPQSQIDDIPMRQPLQISTFPTSLLTFHRFRLQSSSGTKKPHSLPPLYPHTFPLFPQRLFSRYRNRRTIVLTE